MLLLHAGRVVLANRVVSGWQLGWGPPVWLIGRKDRTALYEHVCFHWLARLSGMGVSHHSWLTPLTTEWTRMRVGSEVV